MSEHDNWRAKCTEPRCVAVRPYGNGSCQYGMGIWDATELRDQLTAAIEEAKRLEDPFEKWWAGLTPHPQYPDHRFIERRSWVGKEYARMIYDAIRKDAP